MEMLEVIWKEKIKCSEQKFLIFLVLLHMHRYLERMKQMHVPLRFHGRNEWTETCQFVNIEQSMKELLVILCYNYFRMS